jgi:hypothetical protein
LRGHLRDQFGPAESAVYWEIFEQLCDELGYADYLGALQRYRLRHLHEPRMLAMSSFLVDYPFAQRVYPGAREAIAHCQRMGKTVVLSDGDVVFQPRKVQQSGIWDAVRGHVLIYIHKEQELIDVERRYPAPHYVLVDDKLRILHAVKQAWGERVTTIFPRQGHYAVDPQIVAQYPPADITIAAIGELTNYDWPRIRAAARHPERT